MATIETRIIDLQKLAMKHNPSLIIRFMIAFNDLAVANNGLMWSREQTSPTRKHLSRGMGIYFIRLQIGHLNEGIKIIDELMQDAVLIRIKDKCNEEAKQAFSRLLQYTKYGNMHGWFINNFGKIRHNLTFHYEHNGKLIERRLADRASRSEGRFSNITRGNELSLWRFCLADDIIDSIICRDIFQIPRNVDLQIEADNIMDQMSFILKDFMIFTAEFIYRYLD